MSSDVRPVHLQETDLNRWAHYTHPAPGSRLWVRCSSVSMSADVVTTDPTLVTCNHCREGMARDSIRKLRGPLPYFKDE